MREPNKIVWSSCAYATRQKHGFLRNCRARMIGKKINKKYDINKHGPGSQISMVLKAFANLNLINYLENDFILLKWWPHFSW